MFMNMQILEKARVLVRSEFGDQCPVAGLVLGSGWGDVISGFDVVNSIDYERVPGLGAAGVPGHAGRLVLARHAGILTLVFQGRRHFYEGEGWTPVALPIYLLKSFGAEIVLLTNAAGGIRPDLVPGSLMVLGDHINMMGCNPLQGACHSLWGARFPDMSEVYDLGLRHALLNAAAINNIPCAEGVYAATSGPCYETPSEVHALQTLGADAVGMSTVPEAILAHAAGIKVGAVSCITNLAAGIGGSALRHEDVVAIAHQNEDKLRCVVENLWMNIRHHER